MQKPTPIYLIFIICFASWGCVKPSAKNHIEIPHFKQNPQVLTITFLESIVKKDSALFYECIDKQAFYGTRNTTGEIQAKVHVDNTHKRVFVVHGIWKKARKSKPFDSDQWIRTYSLDRFEKLDDNYFRAFIDWAPYFQNNSCLSSIIEFSKIENEWNVIGLCTTTGGPFDKAVNWSNPRFFKK